MTFMLGNPALSLGHAHMSVAQEFGYWKAAGVNVKIRLSQGTSAAQQGLTSGLADMAQSDTLSIAESIQHGQTDFEAVCPYVAANIFVMLTKPGSSVQTAHDLIGKKIGVEGLGTGGYQFALELLKSQGVADPAKGATFVVIPTPAGEINALENGTIDALSTIDVSVGTYEAQGHKFTTMPQVGPTQWWWNFVVARKSFVQEHPDAVAAVCKGIQQGEMLTAKSPQAALAAYKKDPLGGTTGLGGLSDAQAIDVIKSRATPGFRTYPQGKGQWGWTNLSGEQQVTNLFHTVGILKKPIDVSQYYTNQFLAQMQPDAQAVQADIDRYGSQ